MKHYVYKITELDTESYYIGLRSHEDPYNDEYMGSYKRWEPKGKLKKDILIILPTRNMAALVERSIIEENIDNNLCGNAVIPSVKQSANQLGTRVKEIVEKECNNNPKNRILQYTLNGEFVCEWDSVVQASKDVGVTQPTVSAALSGKSKSAGGYLWRYKESENFDTKIKPIQYTNINQYDLDGNFIRVWNGLMEIEEETGYNNPNIVACCRGRVDTAYGYNWEYANK